MTLTIADYRTHLGLKQDQFGALFGLRSKGQVSVIERDNRCSPEIALAIEGHSAGRVDAASLNDLIRRSRLHVSGFAAHCPACEAKAEGEVLACVAPDCPARERRAA